MKKSLQNISILNRSSFCPDKRGQSGFFWGVGTGREKRDRHHRSERVSTPLELLSGRGWKQGGSGGGGVCFVRAPPPCYCDVLFVCFLHEASALHNVFQMGFVCPARHAFFLNVIPIFIIGSFCRLTLCSAFYQLYNQHAKEKSNRPTM